LEESAGPDLLCSGFIFRYTDAALEAACADTIGEARNRYQYTALSRSLRVTRGFAALPATVKPCRHLTHGHRRDDTYETGTVFVNFQHGAQQDEGRKDHDQDNYRDRKCRNKMLAKRGPTERFVFLSDSPLPFFRSSFVRPAFRATESRRASVGGAVNVHRRFTKRTESAIG
jgi:hypothetical protein